MCLTAQNKALDLYVATNGNDTNNGSIEAPFKTISKAKQHVRNLIQNNLNSDINIYFREGNYVLNNTEVFGLKDYSEDYDITYAAYNNENVVFSSGQKVTGWKKSGLVEFCIAASQGDLHIIPLGDWLSHGSLQLN
mgnify:CR=1 FL=1